MNDRESHNNVLTNQMRKLSDHHMLATLIGYIADAVVCGHEVSKSRDLSISPFLLPVMLRLMTNERHRAVGFLEVGVGIRQMARMIGCSPPTIINLRRRYQETNTMWTTDRVLVQKE